MCLCKSIALAPIALESCSNTQKTQQVFESAIKNKIWGFGFFVSDVISGVVLGLFGPLHLVLGPNR